MEILAQNPTEKFLLLQSLESYLQKTGLSPAGASAFTLLATFAVLALLVWVLDRLGTKVLLGLIRHAVSKTETLWDDHLLRHKFFPRLIELATAGGLLALVRTVFSGYGPALIGAITLVLRVYMTVVGALMIGALLNTVNDIYESKPQSRRKSIRGYIQTAKIVVWIIAGILIVSILIGRDPTDLLLGLGASAALVSLVFKDTILGFVASIQLSAQDMIRPGDWIEMPSKGADGVVSEINVNSVKVRNWDNTMTMIPIYSLVSESFTNWRNMEESAGRRFKRPLRIDATTVSTLSEEQLTALTADPRIVKNPAPIASLSYPELQLLSGAGTQVLHESAVAPVRAAQIPLQIRSTFAPELPGTRIGFEAGAGLEETGVVGFAGRRAVSMLRVLFREAARADADTLVRACLAQRGVEVFHNSQGVEGLCLLLIAKPGRTRCMRRATRCAGSFPARR